MFGSVVVIAFQSVFHSEKCANNIFFIFLKLFLRLAHQNNLKISKIYYFKKKNLIFSEALLKSTPKQALRLI
jgi:hypothetical protein